MSTVEIQTHDVVDSAFLRILASASDAVQRAAENLVAQADSCTRVMARDRLLDASSALKRHSGVFQDEFKSTFRQLVKKDLEAPKPNDFNSKPTDWMSLTLVDEEEVDDQVISIRICNQIAQTCESEFREMLPFLGAVLKVARTDEERNPIRPSNIGRSVYAGLRAITEDHDLRRLIASELLRTLPDGLRKAYVAIREELQQQGVEGIGFTIKTPERHHPNAALPAAGAGIPMHGNPSGFRPSGHDPQQTGSGPMGGPNATGFTSGDNGQVNGAEVVGSSGTDPRVSHQQWAALLSKISQLSFEHTPSREGRSSAGGGAGAGPGRSPADGEDNAPDGLSEPAPTNLIRSHRSDLMKACTSKLDETVIDIVAGVFDQILSDPQVATPIALLIARLQLPVLRIALLDNTFFSSRVHPVRKFVNRIASLSCAFDNFDGGPARRLLDRMRDLIQEVGSNLDQNIEGYDAKVRELETFVAELARNPSGSEQGHVVDLLTHKESELRVQQRYMLQLQRSLKPINIPAYLRDFLSQVWSQAIVLALRQRGPDDEQTKIARRTGRDLILSVQPKSSPALRKAFIKQLPGLMKNLKGGLALIGWPQEAQDSFITVLLASHSVALRQPPLSELDRNMLSHQLDTLFDAPIVGLEVSGGAVPLPEADKVGDEPLEVKPLFTQEEAQSVGLVEEDSVDWSSKIDVEPEAEDGTLNQQVAQTTQPGPEQADLDVKINPLNPELNLSLAEPPAPSVGPSLIDHMQLGNAYYMMRKNEWQKVRLSFISPGRSFFTFSLGQEVISCTVRMVRRMCEAERLRAAEGTGLLERATARTVNQMVAMQAPNTSISDRIPTHE